MRQAASPSFCLFFSLILFGWCSTFVATEIVPIQCCLNLVLAAVALYVPNPLRFQHYENRHLHSVFGLELVTFFVLIPNACRSWKHKFDEGLESQVFKYTTMSTS